VTTVLGRRRYLPDIKHGSWKKKGPAERKAVNTRIQGSASDVIKVAMRNVIKMLKRRGWFRKDVFMVSQVHDELIFEVEESIVDEAVPEIKKEMESAVALRVPLIAEPEVGNSWAEAH